jgi:hypothetical protein
MLAPMPPLQRPAMPRPMPEGLSLTALALPRKPMPLTALLSRLAWTSK